MRYCRRRSLTGRLPSSRTSKLRTSLRFPFGCLANKRRKVAITLSMRRPVGVKRIRFVFRWTRFFSRRVAADAILPSALRRAMFSLSASWAFSLHPVLPPDYRPLFRHEDGSGPGVRRSHRNSAFGLCLSFFAEWFLSCCRQRHAAAIARQFVHLYSEFFPAYWLSYPVTAASAD
jgi:hypothetical protein